MADAAAAAAGCLVVLVLVLPLGAALDARRERSSDQPEARRLLAFVIGAFGLGLTIIAMVMVGLPRPELDDTPAPNRLQSMVESLRTFVSLLLGTSDAGPSIAAASAAIIGTALIAASLALYWHNRPTRAPTR